MSKMGKRIVFGAIMIAVLAGVLWGDWRLEGWARFQATGRSSLGSGPLISLIAWYRGLPAAILMAIISTVALLEFRRMATASGGKMLLACGLMATILLATGPYWVLVVGILVPPAWAERVHPMAVLPLAIAIVFAGQMARRRTEQAIPDLATTILAVAYIGGGGAAILAIRMTFGVPALVLFLVAAKITDIGAYFTGSFFGKHKLIPWLSPGKSWEGLIGGLAIAAGTCLLIVSVAYWCQWKDWPFERTVWPGSPPFWYAPLFGAVVGLVGQFADLCESLLKRSASLKDSGALVPEFGGVLDIIDSLLLSAPVAVILLAIMA